jgi:hypothetical protein
MAAKKAHKLDLNSVLSALDRQDFDFYSRLSDEDKKAYVPLILMRYMSLLTDQNKNAPYAVIATNDLVNIGFWNLTKHPELQHKLLCLAGLGNKQYRSWIGTKKTKKSNKIYSWLSQHHPEYNEEELDLFMSQFTKESWLQYLNQSGISDAEVKELASAWKNLQT